MELRPLDLQFLTAATGYLELEMYHEANENLDEITPQLLHLPNLLAIRLRIYAALEKWELMQVVAKRLVNYEPDNLDWIIPLANATRRIENIGAARMILEAALKNHPGSAVIFYNLACYCCQVGEIETAKKHLKQAFKLEPGYRLSALDDEDLKIFWAAL